MGISVLPTGWEGLAEGIENFGEGVGAGLVKRAELRRKEEEVDTNELLNKLLIAKSMNIDPASLGITQDTITSSLGIQPPEDAVYTGGDLGQIADAQIPSFSMRSGLGQIPNVSPADILMKKQFGFETNPMLERNINAKVMEKEALGEVESKQKRFDAQYKQAFESEGAFRQLEQASNVMARGIKESMLQNQSILKNLGIELDPTRGVSGLTFAKTLQVASALGYNDFADAVGEGLTTEMAVEIGKMLGQGAGMRMGKQMIGIFRKTLPNLKGGTLASNLNQLAYSMQNAYRKEVSNKRDEKGNLIYKTDGERESQIMEYDALYRKKLFGMFEEAGLYTPKKILMEKGKEQFEVPDYLADYFEYNKFKRIR